MPLLANIFLQFFLSRSSLSLLDLSLPDPSLPDLFLPDVVMLTQLRPDPARLHRKTLSKQSRLVRPECILY